MGQESNQDVVLPPEKSPVSIPYAIVIVIQVLMTDLVLYGCMIPLLGTCLGGYCASWFSLCAKWELMLIIFLTFLLNYGTFCLMGEASYWRHLFAFDKFYCYLLQIRDLLNCSLLIICVFGLASTMEVMVLPQDRRVTPMKAVYVSEGIMYVFLQRICQYFKVGESFVQNLGFKQPSTENRLIDANFLEENEQFGSAAMYMLYWAVLTGCVLKLIYFNTLFTYMRAIEIFLSMNPMFGGDDKDDGESSVSVFSKLSAPKKSRQSRMEKNFARSMRRLDEDLE